jgi:hypothetical protein
MTSLPYMPLLPTSPPWCKTLRPLPPLAAGTTAGNGKAPAAAAAVAGAAAAGTTCRLAAAIDRDSAASAVAAVADACDRGSAPGLQRPSGCLAEVVGTVVPGASYA